VRYSWVRQVGQVTAALGIGSSSGPFHSRGTERAAA